MAILSDSSKKPGNNGRYAAAEMAIIPKPISNMELFFVKQYSLSRDDENIPDSHRHTIKEEVVCGRQQLSSR